MDDITLVRASLKAGLGLYGRPNPRFSSGEANWKHIQNWCRLLDIDPTPYENKWIGSGLIWTWGEHSTISRVTFTQHAIYFGYCVGFEDFDECVGNIWLSDVYTFLPNGTGFDVDNPFDDRQWYNGRIAYYFDNGRIAYYFNNSITEIIMDMESETAFYRWLKQILASEEKIKKHNEIGKKLENLWRKINV